MMLPRIARTQCPRRAILVAAFLGWLVLADPAVAQSGTWTAHTSMREVTAISASSSHLWVGTTGGVFSYEPATGEIRRYTIADGLHGIQVRSVAFDPDCIETRPCVWIGYQDGVLDRLDPEAHSISTFRDIERADRFQRREINRLVVHGDSLLVATSFGLVVFDIPRGEVRDSYTQLGWMTPATPVFDVIVAPDEAGEQRIWLAADAGIAHAPLSAPNLKDPATWSVEISGLPSIETRAIAHFEGTIHVGTRSGHAVRSDDGTYAASGITGQVVSRLQPGGSVLLGVDAGAVFVVGTDGVGRRLPSDEFNRPGTLVAWTDDTVWIGDQFEGMIEIAKPDPGATELTVGQKFFPEGPYHNLFTDLEVDADGSLWAAGVFAPQAGTGFYRMDASGAWTNFIPRSRAELQGRDSYTQIHVDRDGKAWAGSLGSGVAVVEPDDAITIVDHRNSSLVGAGDSSYILVGGIGSDSQGRIWITSHASQRPLNVRDREGNWTNFVLHECQGLTAATGTYERIFVDSYGQIWLDVKARADLNRALGLLVLNPLNTPTDPSDDVCRFFGATGAAGSGMPGLEVLAVAEDNAGRVWIATDKGLAYFINNGLIAHDAGSTPIWPQYEDRSQGVFLFQGLKINDVAVDPANQLWVATDAGAYLIRQVASGFEEVIHWTTSNSPLLSNLVVAVTVEPRTGTVFFATDRGLVSYEGDAIAAAPEARDLVVYPNPVRVGRDEEPVIFIEGLVEETEILILSAPGTVISRFQARGGRARWDGRDTAGRLVPSGMYLIVAIGQNGEERAFGKVGIVR